LEQLAFNPQHLEGSCDPGHALFGKFLRGHVRSIPGNMIVKFEVCNFNCIWTISI